MLGVQVALCGAADGGSPNRAPVYGQFRQPWVLQHPIPEGLFPSEQPWDFVEDRLAKHTMFPPEQPSLFRVGPSNSLFRKDARNWTDPQRVFVSADVSAASATETCNLVNTAMLKLRGSPGLKKAVAAVYLRGDVAGDIQAHYDCLTRSPAFAFAVKEYWHGEHPVADHSVQAIQLGTMACGGVPRPCDVRPSKVLFTTLLTDRTVFIRGQLQATGTRGTKCLFFGDALSPEVKDMADHFRSSRSCNLVDQGRSIHPWEYHLMLADASFIALPKVRGTMETHGMYEAMLTGTIPVMLASDMQDAVFLSLEDPIPAVVASTWPDATAQMAALLANRAEALKLQRRMFDWLDRHNACMWEDMRWVLAAAEATRQGKNICDM